ncbi:translation termination inhibitor protein itt1 [Tulasnella sp. 330]|nr:translation termination inhibitor protein itt1 [Tulasnella sp. 330]KAG8889185.1 translation termination inhibitor protein itt1 [Tulasnella sp. 332]
MPPPPEYHTLSLADMSIGALQTEQCAALQQEEQEVMQAIYADRVSFKIRPPRGTHVQLRVSVDLAAPCQALIVSADGTTASSAQPAHTSLQENEAGCRSPLSAELTLSHLPPIILTLSLPPGYPLYEPAAILSLHATHSWITSTSIDKLWEIISDIAQEGLENGGEGVLWRMYELLRDGQVLSYLDLKIPHRTLRLRIPHPTPRLLYPLLLSYNTAAASQEFATQSYPCPICLISCLSDFWTLTIQQGEIERVGCVDEACVKSSLKENFDDPLWASVGEEQIREVVGEVLLQRWIHLRDKRMVERVPKSYMPSTRAKTTVDT